MIDQSMFYILIERISARGEDVRPTPHVSSLLWYGIIEQAPDIYPLFGLLDYRP